MLEKIPKPVKMEKIRILSLISISGDIIRVIHKLGMIEINTSSISQLESGKPTEVYNDISEQLIKIRGIKNALEKELGKSAWETAEPINLPESLSESLSDCLVNARHITLDKELRALIEQRTALDNSIKKLEEEEKQVELLSPLDVDFSALKASSIKVIVGKIDSQKIDKLRAFLDRKFKHYNLRTVIQDNSLLVLLIHPIFPTLLESELESIGFSPLRIPDTPSRPGVAFTLIKKERNNLEQKKTNIEMQIKHIYDSDYKFISSLERALTIEADRAVITSRFSFGKQIFVIDGWIKSEDMEVLVQTLHANFGKNVIVESIQPGNNETPPTVIENKGIASPFEYITKNYSFPGYFEIDPTVIYFITIPLLYGMIMGDVVYGVISIFIARWFMKKFKKSEALARISLIWYYSALPAILFGLIFDEWAGMTHFHLLEIIEKWGVLNLASLGVANGFYNGLSRIHNLGTLLGITTLVGLFHIAIGFVLGALVEYRHNNKKHALAKIAWIGVETGGTISIMSYLLKILPADIGLVGAIILLFSMIILGFTEGVVGILEIPGLAGNVLSYMRIAVVGVVGTILAELINELFLPLPSHGIIALIFFPLFIIFHAVNTFIVMFESIIQGGRLNVVEFKMKFLHGGGKIFEPFSMK